jgi:predicted Zn-dependent peptidase
MANGMVVGILPELGSPVFGLHLLVADRALTEPESNPGVSDLIHRLLPAGTGLSGSRELDRRLARAGVEVKAADSPAIPFDDRYHVADFSYLRMEGPAGSLGSALSLLAEMIREPAWDEAGWTAAVASHRAARKADNRGGARADQELLRILLGDSHPLIGPVSGSLAAPVPSEDEVRRAWGQWPGGYFASDRLILTVASPVPVEQALEAIEDLFSAGGEAVPRRGPYPKPKPEQAIAEKGLEDAPQLTVLWGRTVGVAGPDRAALVMAANALSDRMVAEIREREGLAYRLGAGVRVLPDGSWLVSARVGTRPENRDQVVDLLTRMAADLGSTPLAADDLARLAARSRRSTMLRSLTAASRAYRVGRVLFEGPASTLAIDNEALAAVTPEQVQAAAATYLDPEEMILVVSD